MVDVTSVCLWCMTWHSFMLFKGMHTSSNFPPETDGLQGLANPDNTYYDSDWDVLFIGEDTDLHQNDMVWAIDPDTSSSPGLAASGLCASSTYMNSVHTQLDA